MSKDNSLISVLLPVYNAEGFIAKSIESILDQSYKNFELIIINDGSTDKSLKICEEFKQKDDRIILLSKQNEGLTKALNFGIQHSSGYYIARQDADDISLRNRFQTQIKFIKNNNLIMCGTNCEIIKKNKKKINWSIEFSHEKIIKKLEYSNCFVHSSIIFKKEFAKQVNFYDESLRFAQDYDLWWKLSLIGKVGNIKEKLIIYNQHESSISSTQQNDQISCFINSAIKYYFFKNYALNYKDFKFEVTEEFLNHPKCLNQKNLLLYYYSDKLSNKKKFKNLSYNEKINIFKYPSLLIRKLLKL